MTKVFVTGGIGYIGSHTVLQLLDGGYSVVIMDNLRNSFPKAFDHMERIAGDKADKMKFVKGDVRDKAALDQLFAEEKFDAVIHFAGLKAVGESVAIPLEYYDNNIVSTLVLLEVMKKHNCWNMVFSSSCTVYGMAEKVPLTEDCTLHACSPYGRTKLMQEEMFQDVANSDKNWRILLLRYFNPVGAHPSGEIGEHPIGVPNNLMPYVHQVALGQREMLRVFGGDYPTSDGTCIRDYIHVMDLGEGHVYAVRKLLDTPNYGCKAVNLGTGKGTSVLEMVNTFQEATGAKVPYQIVDRRPGDTIAVWAATEYAEKELGWKAKLGLTEMCRDQWAWAKKYPKGYETS
jgi:UDP-glucose 4-epimerase